jgi:DNA-binding MarR family transcriptional regulator
MDIFHDYAFVVGGKKRKEVVKLLADPRTPTELSKMLRVHANVITRILRDLAGRELVNSYIISGRKKTYVLTKRGELARQVLDNLIEPKTLSEMLMHLRSHHKIAVAVIKQLIQHGFVTILKNINPTRKIIRLTQKGEAIREKLD